MTACESDRCTWDEKCCNKLNTCETNNLLLKPPMDIQLWGNLWTCLDFCPIHCLPGLPVDITSVEQSQMSWPALASGSARQLDYFCLWMEGQLLYSNRVDVQMLEIPKLYINSNDRISHLSPWNMTEISLIDLCCGADVSLPGENVTLGSGALTSCSGTQQ